MLSTIADIGDKRQSAGKKAKGQQISTNDRVSVFLELANAHRQSGEQVRLAQIAPKTTWLFWRYLVNKSDFQKILEATFLTKIQPKTLLQIFCEFMIDSKVILKSIKGPDNKCQGDLQAWMAWWRVISVEVIKWLLTGLRQPCIYLGNPKLKESGLDCLVYFFGIH